MEDSEQRFSASDPVLPMTPQWWGITDIIKEQAKQISEKGYRCLVPDLYKGKVGVDAEEASHVSAHSFGSVLRCAQLAAANRRCCHIICIC